MIRRPPRSTLFPTRRSSDLYSWERGNENSGELTLQVRGVVLRCSMVGLRPWTVPVGHGDELAAVLEDRKSTRLNSSHMSISYAVFCLKKKKKHTTQLSLRPC